MTDDAIVKRMKVIVKDHGGQLALANAIGVDQGFISKIVNQKQEMSYYLIRKLCFQLKYSPEWLILGTGDKKDQQARIGQTDHRDPDAAYRS